MIRIGRIYYSASVKSNPKQLSQAGKTSAIAIYFKTGKDRRQTHSCTENLLSSAGNKLASQFAGRILQKQKGRLKICPFRTSSDCYATNINK